MTRSFSSPWLTTAPTPTDLNSSCEDAECDGVGILDCDVSNCCWENLFGFGNAIW